MPDLTDAADSDFRSRPDLETTVCVCVCVCVRVLCVPQASSKNIDIPSSPLVSPAPLAQELEPSTMVLSVRGKKNLRLEGTL